MTAAQPSSTVPAWRLAVIGLTGALAVGIGVALGSFLLGARTASLGSGASYVPASAPFYLELRLEPSEAQDASLRELLGRFPAIEGIDLDRPLYEQLGEAIDDAAGTQTELSWTEDVVTWFDGRVGLALLDIPAEAMAPTDLTVEPVVPSMVVLLGVEDRTAAEAAIGRLREEAGEGTTFTEQMHAGVSIQVADTADGFAYALTDDQLIFSPAADDIAAAIDAHASSDTTLSEAGSITRLTDALPADWLVFGIYDFTDVMAAAFEAPGAASPGVDALRELMEHQPLRGAIAVTAEGDRVAVETASDPPTGPFAVTNADRRLAEMVPADVLYYAEGGNLGGTLTAIIGPLKEAVAAAPDGQQQLEMIETALGGDIEELVEWMGDAATVIGWDGEQVWGGAIIVPTDAEAAADTMSQLATFASLASLDPSIGIRVEEREVDGGTIISIRWSDPNASGQPDPMDPTMGLAPSEIVVEWLVTEERVLLGVGDRFVERIDGQDAAGSLAQEPRYRDAVAELGGASNAGVTWLDVRGIVAAVEAAVGDADTMMGAEFEAIGEWLAPLDRFVSVSRVDGDVLVGRSALLVE